MVEDPDNSRKFIHDLIKLTNAGKVTWISASDPYSLCRFRRGESTGWEVALVKEEGKVNLLALTPFTFEEDEYGGGVHLINGPVTYPCEGEGLDECLARLPHVEWDFFSPQFTDLPLPTGLDLGLFIVAVGQLAETIPDPIDYSGLTGEERGPFEW